MHGSLSHLPVSSTPTQPPGSVLSFVSTATEEGFELQSAYNALYADNGLPFHKYTGIVGWLAGWCYGSSAATTVTTATTIIILLVLAL